MKISVRLKTIGDLVNKGANVADVGADHGLLEKYLLDNEIVSSILAIENKIGPFSILKNNLKDYENVRFSLSSGISKIDEKIDTLIIAGMGGHLIVDILLADVDKLANIKHIIVDPHKNVDFVIEEIEKLGYQIEKNLHIEDGKKYNIISFMK